MSETKAISFKNYGYVESFIPEDLFHSLVEEIKVAIDNNEEMVSGLTGTGVAHHRFIENQKNLKGIETETKKLHKKYLENFYDADNHAILRNGAPWYFDKPWINYQNKHEFIPLHTHDGIWSYNIWINIPYNSDDELKDRGRHASCFHFVYQNVMGQMETHQIKLSKKDNGKIIFFPAKLQHLVYPFYTSDEARISIAGNIMLNCKGDEENVWSEKE